MRTVCACAAVAGWALLASAGAALAQSDKEDWNLHGQITHVWQYHPAFHSSFRGLNSLDPASRGNETLDVTFYAGFRLWNIGEIYINPEIDQGFGLSKTFGVAGFPSGEAYKVGDPSPYVRLQRLFLRHTFDLGGEEQTIDSDANQLGGTRTADNLTLTLGKISVTDIFDTNTYAHDPRADFLNWSIIDAGAYDYAADAWAYTYGIAAEWTQSWWTLRSGLFDLSRAPNSTELQTGFEQYEVVVEGEERHSLFGHPGKLKLLGFLNCGRMGSYEDALKLARMTGDTPETALVRRFRSRPGVSLNLEQQLDEPLGVFLRASLNDGREEAYEFTEINRSLSAGISLKGGNWQRPNDTVGLAFAINGISDSARRYFAAGGLGILIGDGALKRYGSEDIIETYYSAALLGWLSAAFDYQLIVDPAYNKQRGPVSVLGARLHSQF